MRKMIIVLLAVVAVVAVAWAGFMRRGSGEEQQYRFVGVEQGDLESVVSATGTLDAVTMVEVGTQVSGMISKIFVDFNDKVTKGEVIAQLDTTLLEAAVEDAEASLERNEADLHQAERDFERFKSLHADGIAADADFNKAQYTLDVARANVKSARASLDRARRNLGYATITAPVSGTVIERDVDVGQTVAASFSSPRLFRIANDLSEMQILASVDESDIGLIKEGQTSRFTVKAYPDDTFQGTVRQVRLQSTTEENVVNYTVVIDVSNRDGRLLPGMTATVEFLVARAEDVLKVPNAALRFRPSEAMIQELRARRQQGGPTADGDGAPNRPSPSGAGAWGYGGSGTVGRADRTRDAAMLWYVDPQGELAVAPVRTGISDGQYTEVMGPKLTEGMQVIAGITQAGVGASSSPFQSGGPSRGHRRFGF